MLTQGFRLYPIESGIFLFLQVSNMVSIHRTYWRRETLGVRRPITIITYLSRAEGRDDCMRL